MSIQDWPGGYIKPVPPTPSGPYQDSSADGVWTLDQVAYWVKQGLWPTPGNVNPSAFIENLFSTYLYTGTGSALTITNGINLSGEGGMFWTKPRTAATFPNHMVYDTARGITVSLTTNNTDGNDTNSISSFNSNGYSLTGGTRTNQSGQSYVSWTFRKQPKFFDIVTYTGTGSFRSVSHNLGSVPGCIIVKRTDTSGEWAVYHRSLGATKYLILNSNAIEDTAGYWGNTTPTSTEFYVGSLGDTNANGGTFVAYLFAHDAGGFGLSGSENVISCGQTSLDSSGFATVSLGYEPQFVIIKSTEYIGPWGIMDTTRGANALSSSNLFNAFSAQRLNANSSSAESNSTDYAIAPNATGFTLSATGYAGALYDNFVYIAIRRGPMAKPTLGTSVYEAYYNTTNIGNQVNGSLSAVDMTMQTQAPSPLAGYTWTTFDRLRGSNRYINTSETAAEATASSVSFNSGQLGVTNGSWFTAGGVGYNFKRAPGFFDIVCFDTDGSGQYSGSHNLGVTPELLIFKSRGTTANWQVVSNKLTGAQYFLRLNSTIAEYDNTNTNYTASSTSFSIPNTGFLATSATYVGYFFATCPGVSKVGTYTGTGALQQINCGFTSGARFVLIKVTDTTGDWYVWDYARGIVAGNDPYLLLNSTAAQVDNTDYIDTYSSGFEVTADASTTVNISGRNYIFLAIS